MIKCPLCDGPTVYDSTTSVSFRNHMRKCIPKKAITDGVSLQNKNNIKCLVCNGPTVYESVNCRSFLNHRRVCGQIVSTSVLSSDHDDFFTTMVRSQTYNGQSLLQSSIVNHNLNNNSTNNNRNRSDDDNNSIFDSFLTHEFNDEKDAVMEADAEINAVKCNDLTNTMLPFSNPTPLQPYALLGVQIRNIVSVHGAPVGMYDKIMSLMNTYVQSDQLASQPRLMSNKGLQRHIERLYHTDSLKPIHRTVSLSNGSKVTVPTFDVESMILSMLTNRKLMQESNYAAGYNIYSGEKDPNHPDNNNYGEIHTGKAWDTALSHYCGDSNEFMPLALVVFGDKSHTDLHGALSLTPIIFTLSLFNRTARNQAKFWCPMAYVPNLSFGKGESDSTNSMTKVQDEHICLAAAFQSLTDIHQRGGIKFLNNNGTLIHGKVWIHYVIGDTEGNNKFLGHYNSSNQGVAMPYRDCKCSFDNLDNPFAKCDYIKLSDMNAAAATIDEPTVHKETYRSMSKHPIRNAFCQPNLPLSDQIYGPFRMMPPELLHTSGSGLIMYMFESLRDMISSNKKRTSLDNLHLLLNSVIHRQSERDFPRGSIRNGIIDGTKIQSSERRGNLFY